MKGVVTLEEAEAENINPAGLTKGAEERILIVAEDITQLTSHYQCHNIPVHDRKYGLRITVKIQNYRVSQYEALTRGKKILKYMLIQYANELSFDTAILAGRASRRYQQNRS